MMSYLQFNEESDYSEENTCHNEVYRSTSLHHRKKLNTLTFQVSSYYIQYQNRKSQLMQMRDIAKPKREKQIVFFCGEVDAMLIALAKIPEGEESILTSSFYWRPLNCQLHISLIHLIDEFFLFLVQLNETRRLGEI